MYMRAGRRTQSAGDPHSVCFGEKEAVPFAGIVSHIRSCAGPRTPSGGVMSAQSARSTTVLTFDDLHCEGWPTGPLPLGYGGFTWCENVWFLAKEYYPTLHTGRRVALLNARGEDIFFDREQPFDLTGLSLWLLWKDTAPVLVEGWKRGASTYSRELTIYRNAVTRPELDFRGIERARLRTGGVHLMLEDISVLLEEA